MILNIFSATRHEINKVASAVLKLDRMLQRTSRHVGKIKLQGVEKFITRLEIIFNKNYQKIWRFSPPPGTDFKMSEKVPSTSLRKLTFFTPPINLLHGKNYSAVVNYSLGELHRAVVVSRVL